MKDLHHFGCQYIWTNGEVFCKFDRAVVNKRWLEQQDKGVAEFKTRGYLSDYAS